MFHSTVLLFIVFIIIIIIIIIMNKFNSLSMLVVAKVIAMVYFYLQDAIRE